VGPRAGLDVCEKSRPHQDSIPGLSSPYSVTIPTELPGPPLSIFTAFKINILHRKVYILYMQQLLIYSVEVCMYVHHW
jgi:hypothetical protein